MRAALIGLLVIAATLPGGAVYASPASPPIGAPGEPALPAWSTMAMFGGKGALCRLAGLSDQLDEDRIALELVRLLHGNRVADDTPLDRTRGAVLAYLGVLDRFNRAVAASRLSDLSAAAVRAHPRDARPLLAFLGVDIDARLSDRWRDLVTASLDGGAGTRTTRGARFNAVDVAGAAVRRRALIEAGLPLEDLARRLNANEAIPLRLSRVLVPLPLSPALWRDAVFHGKVSDDGLFGAIVRDRNAALLYHGLLSVDGETLAYLGAHADLVSAIAKRYPGAFAAFARSIHIRGGRVALPGGPAAAPFWAEIVDARPDQPDDFIRALLGRGAGVTAWFYDALAHLDAAHLRFALGTDPARFRALHAAFTGFVVPGQIEAHPFERPADDGAVLLAQLRVDANGMLAAPASAALWSARLAATALPSDAEGRAHGSGDRAADAAMVADVVLHPDPLLPRRRRLETVLFAQRVFGAATPADMPAVFVAVHAFPRFETLALTLERIGLRDPAAYVRVMRHAARLADLDSPRRVGVALSQFQGALAVLDRLASQHVLSTRDAALMVESLSLVPLSEDGYHGALGEWIEVHLAPAVRAHLGGSSADTVEDLVLLGLAGAQPDITVPGLPVKWEDELYRVDPAGAELNRLLHVRHRQGGNRLDDGLALHALARDLGAPIVSPADARRLATQLDTLIKGLAPVAYAAVPGRNGGETMRRLADAARGVETAPDDRGRRALADEATQVGDEVLGDVLRSLAYAVAIGDPESNLLLGSDLAADHDFGVLALGPARLWAPWAVPLQQSGGGIAWHLSGSLLALDVPLARFSLRRISSDLPLQPIRLDPEDENGAAHTAALMRAWALSDSARDRLVALVARGRARAAAVRTPAELADLLSSIDASEWRRNLLEWQMERRGRPLLQSLTLSELLWIGARSEHAVPPDDWGPSSTALTGCLCLRFTGPATIDTYGVRRSGGLLSALLPDITLRVAELTAQMNLPAALVPALLLGVTEDVLDAAQPADDDDWIEIAQAARAMARERFEDQVSALTVAGGPLVPIGGR